MRSGAAASVLFFAWCMAHPTGDTLAGERACNVKDCFFARDVRTFDVIDKTTVIVYVGSQRCALRVELRGTFCDLTYAPELVFSDPKDVPLGEPDPRIQHEQHNNPGAGAISFAEPSDPSLPSQKRGRPSLRVCDNNLGLQVSGGAFSESTFTNPLDPQADPAVRHDRFGRPLSADCQVSGVASITDDQVMEIYVAHHVTPPPPPMGPGEIQVAKQAGDESRATSKPGKD
jgi:hypothetical protein